MAPLESSRRLGVLEPSWNTFWIPQSWLKMTLRPEASWLVCVHGACPSLCWGINRSILTTGLLSPEHHSCATEQSQHPAFNTRRLQKPTIREKKSVPELPCQPCEHLLTFFFLYIYKNLFIFGFVGSSLLRAGFL